MGEVIKLRGQYIGPANYVIIFTVKMILVGVIKKNTSHIMESEVQTPVTPEINPEVTQETPAEETQAEAMQEEGGE